MKIKLIAPILSAVLLLYLPNANAFTSYGVRGCGKLISAVDTTAERDKMNKDMTTMVVKGWIAGYVTAHNSWIGELTKDSKADAIARTDIEGVWMSVLNYCRQNPLQNVNHAMVDTLNQLDQQNPKKKR
jgi:hypothetical protein